MQSAVFHNFSEELKAKFYHGVFEFNVLPEVSVRNLMSPSNRFRVEVTSNLIQQNLILIDTYMPNIIYALSLKSGKVITLPHAIDQLSNEEFPYKNKQQSALFLSHKMITLFEAMLIGNFQTEVWKGHCPSDKIFVYKTPMGELEYFNAAYTRRAFTSIWNSITVSKTNLNKDLFSIQFAIRRLSPS